jgi:ABC-type glycerol-3-phosphate transport system permease component
MKTQKKDYLKKGIIFLFLLLLAVSFLYPLYFMFINSLKTRAEYGTDPFNLPPGKLQFANYETMISQFKILNLFKNTFIVCSVTLLFLIVIGVIASYAFAKLAFRHKRGVYLAIIMTIFIPAQVTMIPMYVMFSKVNLVNTFWSVILAYLAAFLPEGIMLMTANFRSIPNELIEASELDGCTFFQIIGHVIIPTGRAAIFLTIIFYFIIMWNDLFTPMILLQKMDVRTVTVALATLIARYTGDPPYQFAGLLLSAIPALAVYAIFQRFIISGITVGAIK